MKVEIMISFTNRVKTSCMRVIRVCNNLFWCLCIPGAMIADCIDVHNSNILKKHRRHPLTIAILLSTIFWLSLINAGIWSVVAVQHLPRFMGNALVRVSSRFLGETTLIDKPMEIKFSISYSWFSAIWALAESVRIAFVAVSIIVLKVTHLCLMWPRAMVVLVTLIYAAS